MKKVLAVGKIGPVEGNQRERETVWDGDGNRYLYLDLMLIDSAKEKPEAIGGAVFG